MEYCVVCRPKFHAILKYLSNLYVFEKYFRWYKTCGNVLSSLVSEIGSIFMYKVTRFVGILLENLYWYQQYQFYLNGFVAIGQKFCKMFAFLWFIIYSGFIFVLSLSISILFFRRIWHSNEIFRGIKLKIIFRFYSLLIQAAQ